VSRAREHGQRHIVLERLGDDEELLAIVGSLYHTLPDDEVLKLLQEYNAGRPTLRRPQ
jgi:hypothetical protein